MAHLDVIRGVTMLLVVAVHLTTWLDIPSGAYWWRYLKFMRMPMFFFVSGFLMYSANFDRTTLIKRSKNRLYSQLWPTLIFTAFFVVVFKVSSLPDVKGAFRYMLFDVGKCGYWFTYVLVEMFFVLAPTLYLFNRFRLSNKWRAVALGTLWFGMYVLFTLLINRGSVRVSLITGNILSLVQFNKFFAYFVLGCIAKIYLPTFTSFYQKHHYGMGALIGYCVMTTLMLNFIQSVSPWRDLIMTITCGSLGITAMLYLFYYLLQVKSTLVQRICSYLAIIGTSTLQIYLLHYFFLESITATNFRSIPIYISQHFGVPFELLFHVITAIIIVLLCLLTVQLLKRIGLYRLIFPSKAKK